MEQNKIIKSAIARLFLFGIKIDKFVSTKKLDYLETVIAPKYKLDSSDFEQSEFDFTEVAMVEIANLIKDEEGIQYLEEIGQTPLSILTDIEELSKIDGRGNSKEVVEYGNIHSVESIGMSYPPEYNRVIQLIKSARQKYPINRMQQRNWLEEQIRISYWPTQQEIPCVRKKFGSARTEATMISKGVYSKTLITISSCCRVEVKAFCDNHGRWFYWWDRYLNDSIATGIEFFPWVDAPDTYVLFATDAHQSPLLCTGPFLGANIRKGVYHY